MPLTKAERAFAKRATSSVSPQPKVYVPLLQLGNSLLWNVLVASIESITPQSTPALLDSVSALIQRVFSYQWGLGTTLLQPPANQFARPPAAYTEQGGEVLLAIADGGHSGRVSEEGSLSQLRSSEPRGMASKPHVSTPSPALWRLQNGCT